MSILKRIYAKLVIGNIKESDDEPNVDDWLDFLETLPAPEDYIDEAYNKYLCRLFHYSRKKQVLFDVASIPSMIAKIIQLQKHYDKLPRVDDKAGVLLVERKLDLDYEDIIPADLLSGYKRVIDIKNIRDTKEFKASLSAEGAQILKEVKKRYRFHPYFFIWCFRELEKHSTYIRQYNPNCTAVYVEERNIASPLLRSLYESTHRKYVSFMHGEYLLRLIQAYMGFSEYYIWDQSYEETFSQILRCNIGKYNLYKPHKLEKKWDLDKIQPHYFCTYYFSAESKESIRRVAEVFKKFEESGRKCKVRPHPRYSQLEVIKSNFPESMIENPKETSIEKSLGETEYVVGLATTVLAEGYFEGRKVVIDDISSPEKYKNLAKRRFVCLSRPHILLSELAEKAKWD